jgi:hypothetical protein
MFLDVIKGKMSNSKRLEIPVNKKPNAPKKILIVHQ